MRHAISIYRNSFRSMLKQIADDYMLFAAMFAPILAGVAIHFAVPYLERMLTKHYQKAEILLPYYPLADLLLSFVTPLMVGFICAMVMLSEKDDRIISYFTVTPLGKRGYLISRLSFPCILSAIIGGVITSLFHISSMSIGHIWGISLYNALLGGLVCLFIISMSANKVEGMAMGKLSGVMLLGIFIPFFIPGSVQYIGGILPSYYVGKFITTGQGVWMGFGLFVALVWLFSFYRRFIKHCFY